MTTSTNYAHMYLSLTEMAFFFSFLLASVLIDSLDLLTVVLLGTHVALLLPEAGLETDVVQEADMEIDVV